MSFIGLLWLAPSACLLPTVPSTTDIIDDTGSGRGDVLETVEHASGPVWLGLRDTGPVLLCFHGNGGSGAGWATEDKESFTRSLHASGYSIICPSSVNRDHAVWDNANDSSNLDAIAVDDLLQDLGVGADRPLHLVGHSNGGGFVSRFALLSSRSDRIVAVQYANASGLTGVLERPAYQVPTLFAYADCDPIVDVAGVEDNVALLRGRGVPVEEVLLDDGYANGSYASCHRFVDTHDDTNRFFQQHADRARR